jgi:outer membrane protein OmpA-like peptidoglycan-associated protein
MKLRFALLAATVLAAPLALSHKAAAQPVTGVYIDGEGGYALESQQKVKNITVNNVQQPYEARVGFHNGFTGNGAVGYGFGNGFRVEVEGDYIENRLDELKAGGADVIAHGKEEKYGAFANVLYDFDIGLPFLYPYVGGGVGYQESDYNDFSAGGININKSRGSLAYQGIAGLSFPISYVPGLSLEVDYRFIGLAGSRKYNGDLQPGNFPVSVKAEHEYNNVIQGGFRYAFGVAAPVPPAPAPAPMPMAAPAPAPAKTYLVFFDWDKYNLTPRATQIIAQAASDSHSQNTTTISVSGYTDTSGTPTYNQGLSERRAKAVAAQLVTDGVPGSEIEIHAYGETHLLVPTGPGVREPQNRRVEIVLN